MCSLQWWKITYNLFFCLSYSFHNSKQGHFLQFLGHITDETKSPLVFCCKTKAARPLIKNTNIFSKLKELDTKRRKYYLKADIRIQNVNSINESYLNFIETFSKLNDKKNKN